MLRLNLFPIPGHQRFMLIFGIALRGSVVSWTDLRDGYQSGFRKVEDNRGERDRVILFCTVEVLRAQVSI